MASTTNDKSLLITLPGDDVTSIIQSGNKGKIGKGLHCVNDKIICTVAGSLEYIKDSNTYLVKSNEGRYIPCVNDRVIGIVEERVGEYYKLNIWGPHSALLHSLAFDGATKRKKPIYCVGTLVYCRVIHAKNDMDPEVSCEMESSSILERRDWMTDDAMYGELKGGYNFRVRINLSRQLLLPNCTVLHALASEGVKFEVCIGVNGVVWVDSENASTSVLISNSILNSQVLTKEQVYATVKSLLKTLASRITK